MSSSLQSLSLSHCVTLPVTALTVILILPFAFGEGKLWGAPQIVCSSILVQDSWRLQALFIRKMIWPCYNNLVALQGVFGERGDNCDTLFVKFVTRLPEACGVAGAAAADCG